MNQFPPKFLSRISVFLAVIFGCCAIFTLSSCSKKPGAAIIGKWQVQGSNETIEFHKDGTLNDPQNPKHNGKYAFTDDSHINLQINTGDTNQPEYNMSCEVHIHGDTMDLTPTTPGQNQPPRQILTRLK